jgi:GNAT superfamily N-acetyltransferase
MASEPLLCWIIAEINITGQPESPPEYQGLGYGRLLMEKVMQYIDAEATAGAYITLLADVPALYEKFGFKLSRPKSEGMYIVK